MDIQAELNWIHQEIDKVNDPTFLEKLKPLLKSRQKSSIETVEEYNNDIESALDNIAKGNCVSEEKPEVFQKNGIENNFKLSESQKNYEFTIRLFSKHQKAISLL